MGHWERSREELDTSQELIIGSQSLSEGILFLCEHRLGEAATVWEGARMPCHTIV